MRESVEVVLLLLLAWWVHTHVSLPAPITLCIKTVVIRSDDDVCNPFDFTSTALSFSSKDNAAGAMLRSDDDEEEEEEEEEEGFRMVPNDPEMRLIASLPFAQT